MCICGKTPTLEFLNSRQHMNKAKGGLATDAHRLTQNAHHSIRQPILRTELSPRASHPNTQVILGIAVSGTIRRQRQLFHLETPATRTPIAETRSVEGSGTAVWTSEIPYI